MKFIGTIAATVIAFHLVYVVSGFPRRRDVSYLTHQPGKGNRIVRGIRLLFSDIITTLFIVHHDESEFETDTNMLFLIIFIRALPKCVHIQII